MYWESHSYVRITMKILLGYPTYGVNYEKMFVIQTGMVFGITFADALCGFLDRFLALD